MPRSLVLSSRSLVAAFTNMLDPRRVASVTYPRAAVFILVVVTIIAGLSCMYYAGIGG